MLPLRAKKKAIVELAISYRESNQGKKQMIIYINNEAKSNREKLNKSARKRKLL